MPTQSVAIADIIYRGPWYRNRGIALLNISLCLAILTSSINGFDSSVLNGLQIVPDWQAYFGFPEASALGLMNAAQNIGALIALPFAPFLSDGIGRRMTIFVGSLFMLGGVTLQALAGNMTHFIASRALIGFGLCFAANASPLLISELAYPTHRGKITAMYNSSWYLGSILSAWVTVGTLHGLHGTTWSWRIPSIIQAVPSLMQALFVWFIPESPRWLIAKGKDREAIRVLGQYHANGNERDPLVGFTYSQIREALSIEKDIARSTSYLSLFATPGNRKRMRIIIGIAMFSQWSGNGLVSFYIHLVLTAVGITDPSTETIINGSLQIWNFIMAISAALLVDRLGRRPLFLTSNAGMLLTFSMWTLTTALYVTRDDTRAAHATIGLIAVFFSFYDIAYTPMLVAYTVEILPYNIRAKGFAVMNFTVCLCLAFNQFINPLALDGISWYYYLFYVGFLTFELIFIWAFLVETKGKTLEETAALFDGESYADNLQNIGHEAATQSHHIFQTAGFENKSDEVEMESRYPDDGDSRRYSAMTDNSPMVRHRDIR